MTMSPTATALCLALAVIVPDQITKTLVRTLIEPWGLIEVIPGFFNISHVMNKGAAFGFLNRTDIHWQTWLLIGVSLVAVAFILVLLRKTKADEKFLVIGLGLILGGAIGNLIDRILFSGRVTDFLDFYVGAYHWPSFNLADTGITLGAASAILHYLTRRHAPDPD
jgi:signal peptidase II